MQENAISVAFGLPSLTWRPSPMNIGIASAFACVAAVIYFAWWLSAPGLGLIIVSSIVGCSVLVGVIAKRRMRVIDACIANRGGASGQERAAIVGARGGDLPASMPLAALAAMIATPVMWLFLDPAIRVGEGQLAVLEVTGLVVGTAPALLAWRLSPWFRVRWCIMMASMCNASRLEFWMSRALALDPGAGSLVTHRTSAST